MSLNNMIVFQRQLRTTIIEVLKAQFNLFNGAVGNAIVMRGVGNQEGDYVRESFYRNMNPLVKRRNPRGTGTTLTETISQAERIGVKVASRIDKVRWTAAQFRWINENPTKAATVIAVNMAEQIMTDYFNVAISALYAAMRNDDALLRTTVTSASPTAANRASFDKLITAQAKFGDSYDKMNVRLTHSKPVFDLWGTAIANANNLFDYGNVKVMKDPLGKIIIMTDSPSLVDLTTTPGVPIYRMMCLTPESIVIEEHNDFLDEVVTDLSQENIAYIYQAEWSHTLKIKGYSWDITNGGAAPSNAALTLNTNWDKYGLAGNAKELPGVILEVN